MVEFLRSIGTACVQQNISIVELGRRHGWSDDVTLTILRGKTTPTKGASGSDQPGDGYSASDLDRAAGAVAPRSVLIASGVSMGCLTSLVDDHEGRFGGARSSRAAPTPNALTVSAQKLSAVSRFPLLLPN
jgi:hypothetical protein